MIPYNVNTGSVKQRFWDGQDKLVRDDLTWIKGNHLIQAGGMFQRNFAYFARTDNGQAINNQIVYQITPASTNFSGFTYPAGMPTNQQPNFNTYYSYVLGIVAQSQLVYTRSGKDLQLGPPGAAGFERSIIPFYNLYVADTWHLRPTVTLSYGLSYTVEMPPKELNAKQVMMTYQDGTPVVADDYLAKRRQAALAGQVYQPTLGFATVDNVAGGRQYPYDPFYGGIGPRISLAWNPRFSGGILGQLLGEGKTVLRAGYGRIYGRLNGVYLFTA